LQKSQDPYAKPAIAYAFARAGDVEKAVAELEELIHLLDVKVPWQSEMLQRAHLYSANNGSAGRSDERVLVM
jgi:hypothetical protein